MKIVYVSEMEILSEKIDKDEMNIGVLGVQMGGLKAAHIPLRMIVDEPSLLEPYDICIFIYPKSIPQALTMVPLMKRYCKVVLNQEGPRDFWYDWKPYQQKYMLDAFRECDMFFANNQPDLEFFKAFMEDKVVLSPVSFNAKFVEDNSSLDRENNVLVGGNMCKWYGGLSSYRIAASSGFPVHFPTMGRYRAGEENLSKNSLYLPFMDSQQWNYFVSTHKYVVHVMGEIGGGNLVLTASALGIPCIGNREWDTQATCQPGLAIDKWNLPRGIELMQRLIKDDYFYKTCSEFAKKQAYKYFEQDVVAKIQKKNLKRLL